MIVGDGDTNGRKVAVAEKTGVTVDADGTATHILVTYAGIAAIEQAVSARQSSTADVSLRIQAIEDGSGNAPLIITTASAIT